MGFGLIVDTLVVRQRLSLLPIMSRLHKLCPTILMAYYSSRLSVVYSYNNIIAYLMQQCIIYKYM